MKNNRQNKMFAELEEKEIFELAQDYAYRYQSQVRERNVFPTEEALKDLSVFVEDMPDASSKAADVIDLLGRYGSPAAVPQTGGRFFGFVNGGAVPVSLAVKWLTDFWDQNSTLQVMSPISSKLEMVVEKWLQQLLELPETAAAGFVTGSSSAIFCGLAAARYRILKRQNWDVNEKGLFNAPPVRVVAGKEAHSSVLRAIGLLGLGKENIELVDADSQGRIVPGKIPALDDKTVLVLQAGNVNSGSFDDFETICGLAREANAWVHIDGAFGLWANASASLKYLTRGIGMANSWAVDGHKTLNTPYDCGIVLCEDREALASALHAAGAYLVFGDERDGMLYTPDMSRRARIAELWAVMKYLGREGIDELVTGLHERAVQFARELAENGFEILNDVVFNQVLAFYKSDETTMNILKDVQDQRVCWCGGSTWKGKKVIRLSVCSWATTAEDISKCVESFVSAKGKVSG